VWTSRDYRRGDDLTIHLVDNTTVRGLFLRRSRLFVHVDEYSIEAAGELRRMKGERLLVPRALVKLVEVNGR